ncbi:protein of unknown function [Syntrophus gentianae]|uniref:DUF4410 domain-containing protein n=1 Tax=Syntrophus gentianae TaxID=43775 RepID=A0A1H7VPW3_9BACT|nr:DUF4410 domain-containing protein [Syntrophus gentianae]SEM10855.1 protein of unknown function [Syntrophus gentianae]
MKKGRRFLIFIFLFIGFYGCAGTTPTAEFKKQISADNRLCVDDEANVKLSALEGVVLSEIARQRLETRIREAINSKKKNVQCTRPDKRSFNLESKITQYDEGNAFARAMLAGLGQIHIGGDFILMRLAEAGNESVADFTLKKTFAWGGIYGASVRVEDIEVTFAEGIAETIVAQSAAKADSSQATPGMSMKENK